MARMTPHCVIQANNHMARTHPLLLLSLHRGSKRSVNLCLPTAPLTLSSPLPSNRISTYSLPPAPIFPPRDLQIQIRFRYLCVCPVPFLPCPHRIQTQGHPRFVIHPLTLGFPLSHCPSPSSVLVDAKGFGTGAATSHSRIPSKFRANQLSAVFTERAARPCSLSVLSFTFFLNPSA